MVTAVPDIPGLPERFQLRKYLARRPYGDVVEAFNLDRNELVALKVLRDEGSHADIARAMFKKEVAALKGVSHAAVVQILDSFECGDHRLVIELELVRGGWSLETLFQQVASRKQAKPTAEWRVRMACRLAEAVLEVHRREVIHRDIKPANVLWNRDDDVLKLADFGIAAVLALTVKDPSGMTLRNFYTRPFAAPEQLLQKQPGVASDVYAFALLAASLLALREPHEDFEAPGLEDLLGPAVAEMHEEGASRNDTTDLADTLRAAMADEPSARPSLMRIRDVLERLRQSLVPRAQAWLALSTGARKALADAGFGAAGATLEDLNTDLRVRLDHDANGEFIRIYGRSLYAILRPSDPDGESELVVAAAGQNTGPQHEAHRRNAMPCTVRLRIGPGKGADLLTFAREANRESTRRATNELVERARLIIDIERERLPVFELEGEVLGGTNVVSTRELRIGRASGRDGQQQAVVEVVNGYRLKISQVRKLTLPQMKSIVQARLKAAGVAVPDTEVFDDEPDEDWYTLFDEPGADLVDKTGHMVGKVTRYERASKTLHLLTDKPRQLPKVGRFFVKDYQKERQLHQQDDALEALSRGETVRADMPQLLAETAAHRMNEKPWVDLLQTGLTPEARVRDIVDRVLAADGAFCLQGPPGTGKTTIITEVIAQMLERSPGARILVCAQANDAVANAIEKTLKVRDSILKRDWVVVRDVRDERAKVEGSWSGYEAAYREFARRVKASAGAASGPAAEAIAEWLTCVDHRSRNVGPDYHGLVQVWGTTTARSSRPLDGLEGDGKRYDLVIIDEAAKATVGEVMVPIIYAGKVFLVGDQKQLPPFLEDTTTKALETLGITEAEAKYSLFEHLFALVPPEHRDMLDMQFRMHPSIGDVVSALFYDNKVKNGPKTADRPLPPGIFNRENRVFWVDVVGREEKVGKTSRANEDERVVIARILDRLNNDARAARQDLDVAVIAAYRGQADALVAELKGSDQRWKSLHVKAATVDSFQGREADVVLYSLVRTGDAERRFLADGRRFNVALSRPRSLLVLVGDQKGALGTPRLKQLLDMIPEENLLPGSEFAPPTALGAALQAALKPKGGR